MKCQLQERLRATIGAISVTKVLVEGVDNVGRRPYTRVVAGSNPAAPTQVRRLFADPWSRLRPAYSSEVQQSDAVHDSSSVDEVPFRLSPSRLSAARVAFEEAIV